ncbi:hypothetical protein LTR10_013391 [Elasticomyces elasticus]|uniref:Haloacid dehalogenase, type II n=1 Tax=Exophiala sideris TaxID=1016849 RepID=A0ABR0J505_9EURO|nr:hypothetical protein LTR10_013391 [Elasticomyces elasticus]KAK5027379.1 hypothetical protein LTS07_006981 [Exophiala sideris]KAK5034919.1 hypothetical protein LTR13_006101 [Exophiala sideris]KAK5056347.1 hypothetical protein LTR69_007888 [Exophiala sideris]KAK5181164.1 hypothetical protein LTR44_006495 [Eurotiomycetes sp. CCFEE 6388]
MSSCLPLCQLLSSNERATLAQQWRLGFFAEIHDRFSKGLPGEDIDVTHRRVFDQLVLQNPTLDASLQDEHREQLVRSWHGQIAWPDSIEAIEQLKKRCMVVVLANGTTRLQLDIVRSSGLGFHMLFSSQLLGLTKPSPDIYLKALSLLGVEPAQSLMVAAHAYDLRAAKTTGMRTAYIRRHTEDDHEDMALVKNEFDLFLDGERPLQSLTNLFRR